MATQTVNDGVTSQLEIILKEIATEAVLAHHMACTAHDENKSEIVGHHLEIIETLVQKIGYLADLGIKKIDPLDVRLGDADQWFMPPVYHDAVKAQAT